jgi:hypothetical protein
MYKLLHDNKILVIVSLLFIMYITFSLLKKKTEKSDDSSSDSINNSNTKTISILPNPKKRIQHIHNDIKYLSHITKNLNKDQIELIKKYNEEPEIYFIKLCKDKNIKININKLNKLINYIENVSNIIKNKYEIPRPCQLAKKLNININNLATPNTFSYPSGKVLKSKLLSHYFSYIDARYDYEFQQITKEIELACLYAGINTPFDVRGSLLLAQKMMEKKVLKKFI